MPAHLRHVASPNPRSGGIHHHRKQGIKLLLSLVIAHILFTAPEAEAGQHEHQDVPQGGGWAPSHREARVQVRLYSLLLVYSTRVQDAACARGDHHQPHEDNRGIRAQLSGKLSGPTEITSHWGAKVSKKYKIDCKNCKLQIFARV